MLKPLTEYFVSEINKDKFARIAFLLETTFLLATDIIFTILLSVFLVRKKSVSACCLY